MGLFGNITSLFRKSAPKPAKRGNLTFYEIFEQESEKTGLHPFLFGKYQQNTVEDFDAPPDTTYQPFIISMEPGKIKTALQEIADGDETEFEASVHEHSIIGYLKGYVKGTMSNSAIQFSKKYEEEWREPIEYAGKFDGKIYRGIWKFGNFNHGEFYLSLDKNILK